jgi:hypothetical protein
MQAILRTKDNSKVGIRASFAFFDNAQKVPQIVFDKISVFGLEKLAHGIPVKVEVIGMPSKVMFISTISNKSIDGISCPIPGSLVSIERRQASRYRVTPAAMAFVSFSVWKPEAADVSAPPFFEAFQSMASWVPILDMSNGGACIGTHFPSLINTVDKIDHDPKAHIHLPMSPPIPFQAAIRWKRRIRNRIIEDQEERYQLDFRLGIEFLSLQEDQNVRIRNYLRQLSVVDAI